jgi:hypothetical protein
VNIPCHAKRVLLKKHGLQAVHLIKSIEMFTFAAYLFLRRMRYNTEEKQLTLPDYGRNIQHMVDHCMSIEDRTERNRCAVTIIAIMGNMFPHLRDIADFKHILWDHLAIMSDFQLDVDYPYEIVKKEDLHRRPPRLPYGNGRIAYRHYGKIIEQMIRVATEMEEGDAKNVLIKLLANQMKKLFMTWNKDSVDDRKILKDLEELSNGKIVLTPSYRLMENREIRNNNNNNHTANQKKPQFPRRIR